jgi:hypothetical protein
MLRNRLASAVSIGPGNVPILRCRSMIVLPEADDDLSFLITIPTVEGSVRVVGQGSEGPSSPSQDMHEKNRLFEGGAIGTSRLVTSDSSSEGSAVGIIIITKERKENLQMAATLLSSVSTPHTCQFSNTNHLP